MDRKFKIDFFELSFLATACIPPVPIARGMFFDDLSEKYYHQFTEQERANMFDWVTRENSFNLDNEDCAHFHARFNPDNQYKITIDYKGDFSEKDVYLWNDRYHSTKSISTLEGYITNIEKIKSNVWKNQE
jgi:hypothetical protein